MSKPVYWDYLSLPGLLAQQDGLDGDPSADELHFIIVHQAFELWFKLVLSQLRLARNHLAAAHLPEEQVPFVVHHLGRVNVILRHCVEQFAVMETLPPQDFLEFRDKLTPASGFQSFQLREIEILLGLKTEDRVAHGGVKPEGHIQSVGKDSQFDAYARLQATMQEVTLRDALHAWLGRTPIQGSSAGDAGDEQVVDDFIAEYLGKVEASGEATLRGLVAALGDSERERMAPRIKAGLEEAKKFLLVEDKAARRARAGLLFIESYRELPLLAWPRLLIDTVVELEEQLLLFRNRHARMVERVIGRRIGTGGSSGVEYLDKTTAYRTFPELWTVRSTLLPRNMLPALQRRERYGME
jgi:tryptophan 2,3-dioxygenase